ncbi:MAG TPA: sigma-54 dependent transcriptional regulator [Acidobacteriaceae bacterium]|nr:sigma-54 dependent transcriptional regulator [Acidobacteriaceae bacterium]
MKKTSPPPSASGSTRSGRMHVLIVDEDPTVRSACCEIAAARGFVPFGVSDLAAARSLLRGNSVDILILDLKSPAGAGLELLEEVRLLHPQIAVIVMTAYATVTSAVEAMRTGANDYLSKPFEIDELATVLARAAERRSVDTASRRLREKLRSQQGLGNLIGNSPEMEKIYRILSKVAQTTHPVLILGESGTGKELIARSIHSNSPSSTRPFLPVDCGSLVPTLIESELFGHVKGAFTGATRGKEGLLASAEGGTVFLDEIGEMPLDLQARMLRALQEKEIRPVGATHRVPINCRILAATNRDLATMVAQGRFRKDLYYRLNVVALRIPPLRDRREDIPLLAAHFLNRMSRNNGTKYTLSDDALRTMSEYAWPGNVRELENSIERACALCSGPVLRLSDLPTQLQDFHLHTWRTLSSAEEKKSSQASDVTPLADLERQAILDTLRQLNGDKLTAARLLGIGKTTLYRKLKEYGIGETPAGIR